MNTSFVKKLASLAQVLSDKNKCISFSPTFPLADTVSNIAAGLQVSGIDDDDIVIESIINDKSYNAIKSELTVNIASVVKQEISLYKNVVVPILKEVENNVHDSVKALITRSPVLDFDIVREIYPAWARTGALRDEIDGYLNKGQSSYVGTNTLPEMSSSDLMKLIVTGDADLDGEISAWLETMGDGFLVSVYDTYVRPLNASNSTMHLVSPRVETIHEYIASFIIARKLLTNVPEKTGGTLIDYKNNVAALIANSANLVAVALANHERGTKLGLLVTMYNRTTKTLYLNSGLYDDWLASGEVVETILGNYVGETSGPVTAATLKLNRAKNIKAWDKYCAMVYKEHSLALARTISTALSNAFTVSLNDISEYEANLKEFDFDQWERNIAEARTYIKSISKGRYVTADIDRVISDAVIIIICRYRFYGTNSELFIVAINNIMKQNPDITPNAAAGLVTVDMVLNYLLNNTVVNTVN